jgi:hypothetical protein
MSAGRDPAVVAAHVRFAPKADKKQIVWLCPLSAISGLMHRNKPARRSSLFDPVRFAPNATVGLKERTPPSGATRWQG